MLVRMSHGARRPRAIVGYTTLLILAIPSLAKAVEAPAIAWRADLDSAQAEARARNLPLWVQFTGPWCIYCRKMDHETFPEPGIVGRSQGQFVPVKLQSGQHGDLMARMGIVGLPATVVISPSGSTILAHREGFADPGAFAGLLDGAWANHAGSPEALAMEGFCPVRLVQGKGRIAGRAELAVFHDGHFYRPADEAARDLFLKDPEKFIPADRGRCVVSSKEKAQPVAGSTKFGVYYHERLYLLADDDSRKKFAADPDRFASIDVADNGRCPHCQQASGKPEFPQTLAGKRYLFPDALHREAFRPNPEHYLR